MKVGLKILTLQLVTLLTYHPSNISDIYSSTTVNAAEISTVKFYTSPFQPLRPPIPSPLRSPYRYTWFQIWDFCRGDVVEAVALL